MQLNNSKSFYMKKLTEPKQEDCCNSGCNPCIFDVYEKQLQVYQSNTESDVTCVENAMNQLEYSKFCVEQNIDLKNDHRLVLFKLDSETSSDKRVFWNPGDHFLLKYLSKKINCTRAYTPVKINLDPYDCEYDFAIIVKRYTNGLVSNYLNGLRKGDVTLWRGPYGHYKLYPNRFCRMFMITQGTGITPMYSIIKQVLNNENDITKIVLLYCCLNYDCILLRDELYSFRSFWNFTYKVFLSHNPHEYSCKYQEPITDQRLNTNDIITYRPFSKTDDQFLLCGSLKFMNHYKQWLIEEENIDEECIVTF